MQKRIELFLKVLIGATFFIPLLFFPKSFIFPFIVPKILGFRILTLLMLGAYVILASMDWARYKIRFTWLNISVVLFIFSFGLSTFFGADWYRSFWDNHERMLGLFTVAHYVVYYFIITSVVRTFEDWNWLLRTFLFAGSIVMGIAFIQQFNNEFLLNTSGNRSASTLGNAIYVGGYGIFLTFIGCLLVIREKHNFWKWFAGITGVLGFLGIFFSGTRGAFLGVMAGVIALFIFYFFNLKENKRLRTIIISVILSGLAFFGILFLFRATNFVAHLPLVGRILHISISGLSTTTRGMAWGIAVEGWKDYPVIGWGPGNYYYAFNKYYRPEFLRFGYRETWFDNAHNIVLNTLTERGLVGVIIYLSLFGVAIYMLLRAYKKNSLNLHVVGIGMAFLIAHLVQTMTVFENPTSYLYFFFFLAFINAQVALAEMPNEEKNLSFTNKPLPVGVAVVSAVFVLLFIYSTDINTARANKATFQVVKAVYKLEDPREAYKLATSIPSPHIDDIRNDFARVVTEGLRQYVKSKKPELAIDLFKLVYEELKKNRIMHPKDLRVHSQLTLLLQEAATLSGNKKLLSEAEVIMEEGLKASPKRQQFIYTLAGLKIQLDKKDEAIALYKQAIADDEKISESWWRLALVYSVFDRMGDALNLLKEAESKGIVFDADGQEVIKEILQRASSTEAVSGTVK